MKPSQSEVTDSAGTLGCSSCSGVQRLCICSWNLAGVSEDDLCFLLDQISDNYSWDVLLLQEAFTRTDGISNGSSHIILLPSMIAGNLRCPAIVVNRKWASSSIRVVGQGFRWVAIQFCSDYVCISLHLPHPGLGFRAFADCLDEVDFFLSNFPCCFTVIGMDANVAVPSITDYLHVGDFTLKNLFERLL